MTIATSTASQVATCTIDIQQRILARYDQAVRTAQGAMDAWKREPGNERAYNDMLVKLQYAHEEGVAAKNSDPVELTAQLGEDAIENGAQAVLGMYVPRTRGVSTRGNNVPRSAHHYATVREIATFTYQSLLAFGFIGGIEASATSPESAIGGRYLPEVPASQREALEKAWELLGEAVEAKVAGALWPEDAQIISSRIIDAVLDTVVECGAFVRLS